ncbi:MAG: YitT family protein [Bacillota bacterium]|nr:YitT family protein [Bacillota bacterium]
MNHKNLLRSLAADLTGGLIYAIGLYTFALNANYAPGGLYGIAIIVNHYTGFPIGLFTLIINIPLAFICYKVLGKEFFFFSIKSIAIIAFYTDVLLPMFPVYRGDRLIAAIFMGLCAGGLALIYLANSSTGGSDFVVLLVRKYKPHLTVGSITFMFDVAVFVANLFVYRDINSVLYSIISAVVATNCIDRVMKRAVRRSLVAAVTESGQSVSEELREKGFETLELKSGDGGKNMLLCVCRDKDACFVQERVAKTAPDSLVFSAEVNITEKIK